MKYSERAKAGLRQQSQPSDANRCGLIAGGIMAKNAGHFHTTVHKNITRDRFVRSVNPVVAEKLRAILEELKRKESNRE